MALALHLFGITIVSLLGGELFYRWICLPGTPARVGRWIGLVSYALITGVFVARFFLARGSSPKAMAMTGRPEFTAVWIGVGLAAVLALISVLRLIRHFADQIYFLRVIRMKTLIEMDNRDALREDTFAGVTCRNTEAMLDELCNERAGGDFGVRFEFLIGQRQPSATGWLVAKISCGLDMAWGRGGELVEIAAIREVEHHRLNIRAWRLGLFPLLVLNPFGLRFAQGAFLALGVEADARVRALGEDETAALVELLAFLKEGAEGPASGLFACGPAELSARARRIEATFCGGQKGPFHATISAAGFGSLAAGWAVTAWAIGPIRYSDIRGLLLLDPPGYVNVAGPPEVESKAILGRGWTDPRQGEQILQDGVQIDTGRVGRGSSQVHFIGWKLPGYPITAQVEVVRTGNLTREQTAIPWLVNSYFHAEVAKGIVQQVTITYAKRQSLREGLNTISLPIPPEIASYDLDSYLLVPPGWRVRITGWQRATQALPGPQRRQELLDEVSQANAAEAKYSPSKEGTPMNELLAWDELVKAEEKVK